MTSSSVIDANSFTGSSEGLLSAPNQEIIERTRRVIGPNFRLFYRHPAHLARGQGSYVWDDEGRRCLDAEPSGTPNSRGRQAALKDADRAVAPTTHRRDSPFDHPRPGTILRRIK